MLKIEHVLVDPTSLSLNHNPTNYPRSYFLLALMTKIFINGIMIPIFVVVQRFCQQYCIWCNMLQKPIISNLDVLQWLWNFMKVLTLTK